MGWLFKRIEHSPDLAAEGLPGRATIQSMKLIHRGEFSLGKKKTLELLRGEGTMTVIKTELRLEVAGREPYTVKKKLPVPFMRFAQLGVGAVLPVLVDPSDQERFEVQWDRTDQLVSPTLEQRIATDPYLAAAVEGLDKQGLHRPETIPQPGIVINTDDPPAQQLET